MPSTQFRPGVQVEALPVAEAGGFIWLWPGAEPPSELIVEAVQPPSGFQVPAFLWQSVPSVPLVPWSEQEWWQRLAWSPWPLSGHLPLCTGCEPAAPRPPRLPSGAAAVVQPGQARPACCVFCPDGIHTQRCVLCWSVRPWGRWLKKTMPVSMQPMCFVAWQVHAELQLEVPVDHGLLVENLLDLAHAPFTHTTTFAKGWPVPDVVKFQAQQLLAGHWEPYPIDMSFEPPCMVLSTIGGFRVQP